jgi:hypothetical protein
MRDLAQVRQDLLLGRAQPRPVAALRKRERVEVTRQVARHPRIRVVVPGAAEIVGPLENRHVPKSVPAQLDRRPDPAEAGPDDHDLRVSSG